MLSISWASATFAWICAQNTGHIGEDLAGIGTQGCG
jgi:hypothetical protein